MHCVEKILALWLDSNKYFGLHRPLKASRLVISINDTHVYDKYRRTMLVAIGVEANDPVVYYSEGEDNGSRN